MWFGCVPVVVTLRVYWEEFGADLWHGWALCLLAAVRDCFGTIALRIDCISVSHFSGIRIIGMKKQMTVATL